MSWTKKNVHPGKIVSTSQEVEVMVLEVDPQKRRISLGLKQIQDNPWESFLEKHPVGSEVQGEVKNITEFGIFVGLDSEIDGMVHLSDIDWARAGEEAVKDFKKGDVVKAMVLDVDSEKERISLGIKQLSRDPLKANLDSIKKGDTVTCSVTAVVEGGLEVMVGGNLPGFIRRAELSRDRSEQRPDRFAVGDRLDAKVTNIDRRDRKLALRSRRTSSRKKSRRWPSTARRTRARASATSSGLRSAAHRANAKRRHRRTATARRGHRRRKRATRTAAGVRPAGSPRRPPHARRPWPTTLTI
jgi:small subunit ribosomal protein S1